MKRYIENKNFIPIEYVMEKKSKEKKDSKILILLLIILNFLLLPKSIDTIENYLSNNDSIEVISNDVEVKNSKQEKIIDVLDYLNEDIKTFNFSNNDGTIETENKNTIFYIEEETDFKINSIRKVNDKTYLVEVVYE
ncbi:MAG: hypothetical protein E6248_14545 [Clostridium sp.]|uniref:hypothetical protein n=1 Tax=Clostridium sp. TaxID=1506 RepID=UPI0029156DB5|nr:hypothetical protein [Clostridium sp.]MDU5111659.1 hypothetical protein [Clostridium sp.]